MSFSGKRICVVGATSGMGSAIAKELISRGSEVYITGSSEASVACARNEFSGLRAADVLDITRQSDIDAYARSFSRIDALINCAGASFPNQETEPAVFLNTIAINLSGIGHTCIAMYPALREARGCVVNFGSLTSYLGSMTNPAYSAAKGGIIQLTKSLARMWGPDGIRVNAVSPGYVKTKMTAFRWEDQSQVKAIEDRTPLGRWALPEDIVGPTLFLCSEEARFVTGVSLPVDGGFLLT